MKQLATCRLQTHVSSKGAKRPYKPGSTVCTPDAVNTASIHFLQATGRSADIAAYLLSPFQGIFRVSAVRLMVGHSQASSTSTLCRVLEIKH